MANPHNRWHARQCRDLSRAKYALARALSDRLGEDARAARRAYRAQGKLLARIELES